MSKSSTPPLFVRFCLTALLLCGVASVADAQEPKFLGSIWQGSMTTSDPRFGTLFNQITPENAGKWGLAEPTQGNFAWDSLDQMYVLAANKNLLVKQHCFVWKMEQPTWVTTANAATAVPTWIAAYMARYGNKPAMIDVVNEGMSIHAPPDYKDGLGGDGATGYDWVIKCFELARLYAPNAKLHLNDYSVLKSDNVLTKYVAMVNLLKDRGLIDGLGLQAHGMEDTPASDIKTRLDTLAKLGLPIHISEYDVSLAIDSEQAAVLAAQFPVFWEHPAVQGVTFWGHLEGFMWKEKAYLVRTDGTERPALTWLRTYLTPTVQSLSLTTPQGTAKALTLAGSLPDNGGISYVVTQPAHGNVSLVGAVATYTPTAGYSGSDSFTYTATGVVGSGVSSPATVNVTVTSTGSAFDTWASGYGLTGANAVAAADPDRDGVVNLIEYALGLNPTTANPNPLQLSQVTVAGSSYLRLSVNRNPAVTNVLIEGLSAGTLTDPNAWSTSTTVIEKNTTSMFTVRDSSPIGPGTKRYLRLRFTLQ